MMPRRIRQALVAGSVFVFLVVTIALGVTLGLNLQYLGWQYLTRETTTVELQEVPVEETVVRRIEARPMTDLERESTNWMIDSRFCIHSFCLSSATWKIESKTSSKNRRPPPAMAAGAFWPNTSPSGGRPRCRTAICRCAESPAMCHILAR